MQKAAVKIPRGRFARGAQKLSGRSDGRQGEGAGGGGRHKIAVKISEIPKTQEIAKTSRRRKNIETLQKQRDVAKTARRRQISRRRKNSETSTIV